VINLFNKISVENLHLSLCIIFELTIKNPKKKTTKIIPLPLRSKNNLLRGDIEKESQTNLDN